MTNETPEDYIQNKTPSTPDGFERDLALYLKNYRVFRDFIAHHYPGAFTVAELPILYAGFQAWRETKP
jgi:hypothetical protein